ncbi:hypothetical protein [Flavilitoribacter nigricans]|uniref:Uncharacterized protein n=1 Tax=Flavilitoribacter nigricans (strain ATCC 23147 / DSM 23189 / NBRC 102662 / NCIMB 1420 / SS-2) TaxID=1122177 RepID=A0A2D0MZR9_FLAN2|nr:hypothetical protein [Flavilitoribacter nigricans]PHN01389.1 hypothetical protein CRP01_37635 [Flavilitoribacter nigricans DSM 23189 = NBRC 102662]
MIKTNRLLLLLISHTVLWTSCDCEFNYQFSVINETQTDLSIDFELDTKQRNVIVKPDEELTLAITDGFRCGCINCTGGRINYADSTINYFISDIKIFRMDSVQTTTDFNNEYNWEFESKKKLGVYRARIDESDF